MGRVGDEATLTEKFRNDGKNTKNSRIWFANVAKWKKATLTRNTLKSYVYKYTMIQLYNLKKSISADRKKY